MDYSLTLYLIKEDLNISSDSRDAYIINLIKSAVADMQSRGVAINLEITTHQTYIVDIVCWKFRNRKNTAAIVPEFIKQQERNLKAKARTEKG